MYSQSREPRYDEAAAIGILKHLEKDELQRLLDDDTKLEELISDLGQVKQLSGEKEMLITNNKSVAEYNLNLEPKLVQAKEQLAYSYEEAVKYEKAYGEVKQKLDYQGAQVSLDTSHALLQTEVAKKEEDSENMTEEFLNGDKEDTDFVNDYVKIRTETHVIKVKSEKMGELIRERQRGGQGSIAQASSSSSLTSSHANQAASRPPPPAYQGYNPAPSQGYNQGYNPAPSQPGPLPYPVPASGSGGWGASTPYQPAAMPNPQSYYRS